MGMRCLVSLDGVFVEFPHARELWIPAFAGMTQCFSQALGQWDAVFFSGIAPMGMMDSRLRGNDAVFLGMTECFSRVLG